MRLISHYEIKRYGQTWNGAGISRDSYLNYDVLCNTETKRIGMGYRYIIII